MHISQSVTIQSQQKNSITLSKVFLTNLCNLYPTDFCQVIISTIILQQLWF